MMFPDAVAYAAILTALSEQKPVRYNISPSLPMSFQRAVNCPRMFSIKNAFDFDLWMRSHVLKAVVRRKILLVDRCEPRWSILAHP
ncbi:hypothetical protein MOQ11_00340 [Stenotrophomonas maltophilia]|nr:hypothetical protein [Stenotrophomonas maltophilia]MCI1130327.1 hypothetical protein [Stenotrophomonas maltophilia]